MAGEGSYPIGAVVFGLATAGSAQRARADSACLPRVVGHERSRDSRATRLRSPAVVGGGKGTGCSALGHFAREGAHLGDPVV